MENDDKDSEEEKDSDSYIKERKDALSGTSKHLQKKAKKQAKKQAKVSHGQKAAPLWFCVLNRWSEVRLAWVDRLLSHTQHCLSQPRHWPVQRPVLGNLLSRGE